MSIDYLKPSLYSVVYEGDDWYKKVVNIKRDKSSYNEFCPKCQSISVFEAVDECPYGMNPDEGRDKKDSSLNRFLNFGKRLICAKCHQDLVLYFKVVENKILKIGTYPSTADLDRGRLIYDCSIPKSKFPKELVTAIGLKAHGVFIGAYAYLRRVYETLIIEAANQAKRDGKLPDGFDSLRVKDKISALSEYLPQYMIENRNAYGILSKGVHELSEEDCKVGYDILYNLIVMILEDREERRQREKRKKDLSIALSKLNQKYTT